MNMLVIGSGEREHAICHRLARSPNLDKLFILPGNAGTATLGTNDLKMVTLADPEGHCFDLVEIPAD